MGRSYHAALLLAAAFTALVTAGCTPVSGGTGSQVPSQTPEAPPSSSAAPTAAPTTTVPQQNLRFPNTTDTVLLVGYDNTVQMVTFQLTRWIPGGTDDGHYAPTSDQTYRLPLTATPVIRTINLCPRQPGGNGGEAEPCAEQQFIAALQSGKQAFAQMHVDAADQIDTVTELYHP